MKVSFVLLSLAVSAFATHVKREHHVKANLAKRNEASNLVKRFDGVATYYDVTPNPGACGEWMQPYQHVVALNSGQLNAYGGYVNGKPTSCGRSITISARGQTQQAVIMDECPTCAWGYLDLSEGLFTKFASTGEGVFDMSWWFNDGSGQEQHPTTTTPAWTPPPETTHETTTSTSTTTTSSSSSTTTTSTTSTTEEGSQTIQEVDPTTTQRQPNLEGAKDAVFKLAALINAAAGIA